MEDFLKVYKVFDLEPGASAKRIRQAYIDLVRQWQPDRYLDDPVMRKQAEEKMQEIEKAYKQLRLVFPDLEKPDGSARPEPERRKEELAKSSSMTLKVTIFAFVILIIVGVGVAATILYLRSKAVQVNNY